MSGQARWLARTLSEISLPILRNKIDFILFGMCRNEEWYWGAVERDTFVMRGWCLFLVSLLFRIRDNWIKSNGNQKLAFRKKSILPMKFVETNYWLERRRREREKKSFLLLLFCLIFFLSFAHFFFMNLIILFDVE